MHEAHVVCRREAGGELESQPQRPHRSPARPLFAVADPAKTLAPFPAEREQRMSEQNQLVASLI